MSVGRVKTGFANLLVDGVILGPVLQSFGVPERGSRDLRRCFELESTPNRLGFEGSL